MAGGGGVIDEVRSGRQRRGERYGAQVWRDRTGTLRGMETAGEEEEERKGSGALQSLESDENKHDPAEKGKRLLHEDRRAGRHPEGEKVYLEIYSSD